MNLLRTAASAGLLLGAGWVASCSNSNEPSGGGAGASNGSGGAGGVSGAPTTTEVCTRLSQIGARLSCPGFSDLPTAIANCSAQAQEIPSECLNEYEAL